MPVSSSESFKAELARLTASFHKNYSHLKSDAYDEPAQRALNADAEALLDLTEDTTRKAIPARALWIAAPLNEKQTVQTVLFPEGICYRKDLGFFAPATNELEALVFQCLLELADHGEAYEMEKVLDGGPGWT